ncbi:hypothetical protein BHE74_00001784, partial [Ensete ventricosum]
IFLLVASLASSLSDDLLAKATFEVVQLLKSKNIKPELTRTNIQMIGALRNLHQCTFSNFLQALESFLLRCPRDISPYCDDILNLTMEYLSYDPNFTDNMEEDTDDERDDEEEDEYVAQTESANEYTDDEDASWKVRRAAAKCLQAIIMSRPEMLIKLYHEACEVLINCPVVPYLFAYGLCGFCCCLQACPKLIERFKEREENVKVLIDLPKY